MKNSKIELLRFFFASAIIVFHVGRDLCPDGTDIFTITDRYHITAFSKGCYAVEFFFLLSGFLMAMSIYKKYISNNIECKNIGPETIAFVWRKFKNIFIYYLPLSIITFLVIVYYAGTVNIRYVFERSYSMLFLNRIIGNCGFIGTSWYLSSMLLALLILYPLCRKYYYTFTALIAPVGMLLIVGYLIRTTGSLCDSHMWIGLTYKCNYRAIAEVALGASCYEVCRRMREKEFSNWQKLGFTMLELVAYCYAIIYICSDISHEFSPWCLFALAIGVTLSFSEQTLLGNKAIISRNRLFCYLGSLSLTMYLSQNIFRVTLERALESYSTTSKFIYIYLSTVVWSIIFNAIVDCIRKSLKRNKLKIA